MGLNRYFDFTGKQIWALGVMTALALLMSIYLMLHSLAQADDEFPGLSFTSTDATAYTGAFVLNPNTAPVDSLELLNGIGPALALRITQYRQGHPFERPDDIMKVKGIGPALFDRIKPFLEIPADE